MNKLTAMMIYNWARSTFGLVATDPAERAARLVEESVEVAQTLSVDKEILHKIIDRAYDRPVGDLFNEVGGTLVCILSLCHRMQIDPEEALFIEVNRITSRTVEEWRHKHDEKVVAGTGNVTEQKMRRVLEKAVYVFDKHGDLPMRDLCREALG